MISRSTGRCIFGTEFCVSICSTSDYFWATKNIVLGMFLLPTASFYYFVCLVQKIRFIVVDPNTTIDFYNPLIIRET